MARARWLLLLLLCGCAFASAWIIEGRLREQPFLRAGPTELPAPPAVLTYGIPPLASETLLRDKALPAASNPAAVADGQASVNSANARASDDQGGDLRPVAAVAKGPAYKGLRSTDDHCIADQAEATADVIERAGAEAHALVIAALADPDEQVRMDAVQAASVAAVDLDPYLLESLVRYDPSPKVRAVALSTLVGSGWDEADPSPETSALLEEALTDPSREVSEFANRLLAALRDTAKPSVDEGLQGTETIDVER
jgi:hypothetical protein